MYSVSRYLFHLTPPASCLTVEDKRIGGFPHSEIRGSKVAHTSPRLIAACHVLHRLYAPRHPRIALTSRLRAHTTNISAGAEPLGGTLRVPACGSAQLGMALSGYRCRCFNLSQIIYENISLALACSLRCSLRSKPTPRGIDFKNPFTMSKRRLIASGIGRSRTRVFIKLEIAKRVVELIGIEPMT